MSSLWQWFCSLSVSRCSKAMAGSPLSECFPCNFKQLTNCSPLPSPYPPPPIPTHPPWELGTWSLLSDIGLDLWLYSGGWPSSDINCRDPGSGARKNLSYSLVRGKQIKNIWVKKSDPDPDPSCTGHWRAAFRYEFIYESLGLTFFYYFFSLPLIRWVPSPGPAPCIVQGSQSRTLRHFGPWIHSRLYISCTVPTVFSSQDQLWQTKHTMLIPTFGGGGKIYFY